MGDSQVVLAAKGVARSFRQGGSELQVLRNVDLEVRAGERVAILGRSGSGKSTLMHILAGLDDADHGLVSVAGQNMTSADAAGRARLRNVNMGFVYQLHHLLPEFTALENVSMPRRLAGESRRRAERRAMELLEELALADRATHLPAQLSGGERQRVAFARALANDPRVVLADEPTGNLDIDNAERVFSLMLRESRDRGIAFLLVTHDTVLAGDVDRSLTMVDGVLA